MSDKYFIGLDVFSSSNNGKYKPVSRITLVVDDSKAITAGDDTGYEIVADCPHATQDMVNSLLASLKGHEYQAYSAGDANIDPSAELGDGVTVSGIYSVLSRLHDDGSGFPSLEAPGKAEDEDEYPGGGPMTQAFNRELAATRSLISKTAEEIRLEVGGLDDKYTALAVTIDGVTVTDDTGTTKIKGSSIETSTLKVNAANITGTLTVGNLPAGVAMTSDIPSDAEITVITNNAIRTASISANQITAGTFTGKNLTLSGLLTIQSRGYIGGGIGGANGMQTSGAVLTDLTASNGVLATNAGAKLFSAGYELSVHNTGVTSYGSLWPGTTGAYNLGSSNFRWKVMYADSSNITTSDREKKHDISYEMEKYEALYSLLRPVSYKFDNGTSGRNHVGFISQDVETAIEESGLTSLDFAGFIKAPKIDENGEAVFGQYDYALRYEEFIALNTNMIQRLMKRVSALEAKG